jgi:D-methionine transport system permease protein
MVAIIPVTRMIVGSSIGTTAAIVPLTISAAPFIARIIESSLLEINPGIIEAAQAMGASPMQIIRKVLLPEALHSIVLGVTLAIISLIGYSAMAGALGGGGLGDLAIRYGYQRFQMDVMVVTVIVLIVMVQVMQSFGDWMSKKLNKNKLLHHFDNQVQFFPSYLETPLIFELNLEHFLPAENFYHFAELVVE